MARRAASLDRPSEPAPQSTLRIAAKFGQATSQGVRHTSSVTERAVPRALPGPKLIHSAGELYTSLQPRVARIARAILGRAPAADLVHDICVDAALSAARFRGDSAFSSWLYSVVARHIHKWIRGEQRRRSLLREVVHHGTIVTSTQPDELVSSNRVADALSAALELLSDRQRLCVIRVQIEGHSVNAVAEQLGITPDAVRMNVHRARSRLRSCIDTTAGGGQRNLACLGR